MGEKTSIYYVRNSFQGTPSDLKLGDAMSSADPIAFAGDAAALTSTPEKSPSDSWESDRAFGTHIKEGVAIVKDWVKNG